jgi:L-ascorbate oxidase
MRSPRALLLVICGLYLASSNTTAQQTQGRLERLSEQKKEEAAGRSQVEQLEKQRDFVEPHDLSNPSQAGTFPCGGQATKNGNDISVLLHIAYTDPSHSIFNPDTGANDLLHLRTYNDCLVGPTLRAHPGNTLRITLWNDLPTADPSCPEPLTDHNDPNCFNTGNLHTHGLHVSPVGNSDNVLLNIAPQTIFDYEHNIPSDHPSGTFWYHSHRHGSTALSVTSGMEGVLVVQGSRTAAEKDAALAADPNSTAIADVDTILHDSHGKEFKERVMILQQIAYGCFPGNDYSQPPLPNTVGETTELPWTCAAGQQGAVENYLYQFGFVGGKDVWPASGRYTEINGLVQPTLHVEGPGKIERWRLVHGGVRDTINFIVVQASAAAGTTTTSISHANLKQFVQQVCNGPAVPQFEFALDGLTRNQVWEYLPNTQTKDPGYNTLQPGFRSDILITFPKSGLYCLMDQTSAASSTIIGSGQRLTDKDTQVLGFVQVGNAGTNITGDPKAYLTSQLQTANGNLPAHVLTDLGSLTLTEFVPHPDLVNRTATPAVPATTVTLQNSRVVDFNFVTFPPPIPADPKPVQGVLLGEINNTAYSPEDLPIEPTVNTVEEWTLESDRALHVFHIHVNPFQILDIKAPSGASIFSSAGCTELSLASPDPQYCGLQFAWRDTIAVKLGYQIIMLTKFERYIGEYVIHCHILDHEDQGMMMNVNVVPEDSQDKGTITPPTN